ncbi:hypothetical protein Hanom_Chr01g00039471 [Helianthus anomalus]
MSGYPGNPMAKGDLIRLPPQTVLGSPPSPVPGKLTARKPTAVKPGWDWIRT